MQRTMPEPLAPDESANFVTHALVQDGARWCYRPTCKARLLLGVLRSLGAMCAAAGVLVLAQNVLVGLGAAAAGGALYWLGGRVAARYAQGSSFDPRQRRIQLLQRPLFSRRDALDSTAVALGFDEVVALELLSKRVTAADEDFVAFELNLVCRDGTRHNVVDHRDGQAMAADAAVLSRLLGVDLRDRRRRS